MAFLPSSIKFLIIFFFLISAIPVAYIISVERADPSTHVYHYYSSGWLRECAKWDDLHRRFIVSLLEGGVAQVQVPEGGGIAEETLVIKDAELAGNSSLGIAIDGKRNRVLVVNSDVLRNRYSLLAAYELSTWRRLFLTLLSGPRMYSLNFEFWILNFENWKFLIVSSVSQSWSSMDFTSSLVSAFVKTRLPSVPM